MRSAGDRKRDVMRVIDGARALQRDRAEWIDPIAETTGLSKQGVELGFARHLETEATDDDLERLIAAAGDAEEVHVVLSANVFVAPLRAIAIARACAPRVVVRPSRREPVFARALVAAIGDPAITLDESLAIEDVGRGELHVYGRDETIADVKKRAPAGVVVRGHGAGMGVAVVYARALGPRFAAIPLVLDVVPFDQRGCLSPRVVVVIGEDAAGLELARELHVALGAAKVPRGALTDDERAEAKRWLETASFAGTAMLGKGSAVAFTPNGALLVPPPGRHVHVVAAKDEDAARALLAPIARFVVSVGSDEPTAASVVPEHARFATLGAMQRPPLDGPVDRRHP